MKPRKVFFDHIPKTGGTAVTQAVTRAMGLAGEQAPDLRVLGTVRYGDIIADYEHLPFVGAHVGFRPGEVLAPDRLHCVLLRDPLERLLSAYAFNRWDVPAAADAGAHILDAQAKDAEAYLLGDGASQGAASDWHIAHFLPLGWSAGAGNTSEERFEQARAGLERFELIGFQDAIEEFCDALCAMAGVEAEPVVERVNATSRPLTAQDLDAALVARLRERLAWEYRLYDHARALSRRRRRAAFSAESPALGVAGPSGASTARTDEVGMATARAASGGPARIVSVRSEGEIWGNARCLTDDLLNILVEVACDSAIDDANVGIEIRSDAGRMLFGTNSRLLGHDVRLQPGSGLFVFRMQNRLGSGYYRIEATLSRGAGGVEQVVDAAPAAERLFVAAGPFEPFQGLVKLHSSFDGWGEAVASSARLPEGNGGGFRRVEERALPLFDFSAALDVDAAVPAVRAGDIFKLHARIANRGAQTWRCSGRRRVALSYRWNDASTGHCVVPDGLRTELNADLRAGDSADLWITVAAPDAPGDYKLVLSPVQEEVAWFIDRGAAGVELAVKVTE